METSARSRFYVERRRSWDCHRSGRGDSCGAGNLESAAAESLPIKAGDVFLLFPGMWHCYAPNSKTGRDEYWIGFDGDVPRRLMQQSIFSPQAPVFSPGLGKPWHEVFTRAIEILELEPVGYHQLLSSLVLEMLTLLHALDREERLGDILDDAVVSKAKFLVMEARSGMKEPGLSASSIACSIGSILVWNLRFMLSVSCSGILTSWPKQLCFHRKYPCGKRG